MIKIVPKFMPPDSQVQPLPRQNVPSNIFRIPKSIVATLFANPRMNAQKPDRYVPARAIGRKGIIL